MAEKKLESVSKIKAAISSQRERLNERLSSSQEVIDGYNGVLEAGM